MMECMKESNKLLRATLRNTLSDTDEEYRSNLKQLLHTNQRLSEYSVRPEVNFPFVLLQNAHRKIVLERDYAPGHHLT